jgi:two-component system nitrate/nitrite response regulator NarL
MSSNVRSDERIVPIAHSVRPVYKVLIADRDSMSSDLLANALTSDRRCEAIAVQAADLMNVLATKEVDVVVVAAEAQSGSGNAYDFAGSICRSWPNVYVVVLLTHSTHDSVVSAFRAGVRGVFSRQQPISEFLDCIEHVRKGFIWAGRQEAAVLLKAFRSIPAPELLASSDAPSLTARELQVVKCAATGKTNKAIASELGLSEHTVKNYLFRAFEKLGVSSRVELLFYLTMHGHTFSPARQAELDLPTETD